MSEIPTQSEYVEPDYAEPDYVVPADTVDLDSDPFADDLSKELAAAAPKRWANRATIAIGALVLLVGGFLGGAQVEKHYGKQSSSTSAADLLSQFRNRTARGGFGEGAAGGGFGGGAGGTGTAGGAGNTGTGSAAANTTTGTVKFVDGTTLYVTTSDGSVIIVNTGKSTKVTSSATTTLSKLKVGEKVTVLGPADSSGAITATTVTGTP